RLGDDHLAGRNLLVVAPEMEDDAVRRRDQVGDLLGLVRRHVEHLYAAGRDFLRVVVPVLVPVGDRHGSGPRYGLGEDVIDLVEPGAGLVGLIAEALDDRPGRPAI